MKAAILVKNKSPLVVDDITLPPSLEYGQVLVKLFYSGICGAQINEIDAVKGVDKYLPHLLGHEGSGRVEGVGPGVTKVKKGDNVVLHWKVGAGVQSAVPAYDWKGKKVNAGWVTTFNEYAVVAENRITVIPQDANLKEACLYGCAITSAFGAIHNDSNLMPGESLVVFGAGGLGNAVILAGFAAGASPIIAIDINNYKLKKAKEIGATDIIENKNITITKEKLARILGEMGADVVIDTTGINAIRESAYEITNKTGRTILMGVPKKGDKMAIDSFPLHFDKKITGSFGGDTNPTYDIPRLIRLFKDRKINLDKLISKEFSLKEINKALQEIRYGNVIRCVIKFDEK